jgi:hypothetical protein
MNIGTKDNVEKHVGCSWSLFSTAEIYNQYQKVQIELFASNLKT